MACAWREPALSPPQRTNSPAVPLRLHRAERPNPEPGDRLRSLLGKGVCHGLGGGHLLALSGQGLDLLGGQR